ncbi:MAG TPA: type IV pilus assembly protein PilM [Patescibacteria group bacterium]|nr:type IV pilus assembly protein PilM [Patescibacteria group bacterium]
MEFFGLDIGSYNLKVVQLAKSGKEYRLVAFGSSPSTQKGLASEADTDLTALAEAIKKLQSEAKISTNNVNTALPQDQVFTRTINLPPLSEEELKSAIKWEAEQYVPIPLEEATLAHQVVGRINVNNQEKIQVLIVAAPTRLVEKTLKVLKTAGLNPVSLETEIVALARGLVGPEGEAALVVDLGAKATDMAVVEKGLVVFSRSVSTGGEALTRAIATSLGLDPSQAEAYKKAYGVDPKKLEGKVKGAIGPILDVIVNEIEKTIEYFRSETQKTIKRVILSGGTAGLPEAVSVMASKLSLEIQVGDAFNQIKMDETLRKQLSQVQTFLYATAIGLAMKEV